MTKNRFKNKKRKVKAACLYSEFCALALLVLHIMCSHICPTGCALWGSLRIPSTVSHRLSGPSFLKEKKLWENVTVQPAICPDKGTLSLLCRRIPGLRWWWCKLWAQPWAPRNKSSCTQVSPFLLGISQELWGFHDLPALPGSSTSPQFPPPSLRQGYPPLSFESRCLLSGLPVIQNSVGNDPTPCQDCSWSLLRPSPSPSSWKALKKP